MSDNWVVQNLQNTLGTWNDKLSERWMLLTQSSDEFKGGAIWKVILNIHGALQAVGLALIVLFFLIGVIKTLRNALTQYCIAFHALLLVLLIPSHV